MAAHNDFTSLYFLLLLFCNHFVESVNVCQCRCHCSYCKDDVHQRRKDSDNKIESVERTLQV